MFSKSFLFVVIFTTLATVILSIPLDPFPNRAPAPILDSLVEEVVAEEVNELFEPDSNIGMDMQIAQERFLNNFFNLSSYLVNTPNDTASLVFVPLGSILFAKG